MSHDQFEVLRREAPVFRHPEPDAAQERRAVPDGGPVRGDRDRGRGGQAAAGGARDQDRQVGADLPGRVDRAGDRYRRCPAIPVGPLRCRKTSAKEGDCFVLDVKAGCRLDEQVGELPVIWREERCAVDVVPVQDPPGEE